MVDRNVAAKQRVMDGIERGRIQRQLVADIAAGRVTILDRIAQAVTTGALVLYRPPYDLVFEVKDAKPVLDPRAQPGLIELTLVCRVPLQFPANVPIMTMVRVGTQQAPGEATLDAMAGTVTDATGDAPANAAPLIVDSE